MGRLLQLIRRDLLLLVSFNAKRILFLFFFLIVVVVKETTLLEKSLLMFNDLVMKLTGGETVEYMKKTGVRWPYDWFLMIMLPVMFSYDVVRNDLFNHGSHIMAKLPRRTSYWVSKCITLLIMNLGLLMSYFLIMISVQGLVHHTLGSIRWALIGTCLLTLGLGMCIVSLLFAVLVLITKEITAMLIVIIVICSGLRSTGLFLPTSHLMGIRHTSETKFQMMLGTSLLYDGLFILAIIFMGAFIIRRIDILPTKNEE